MDIEVIKQHQLPARELIGADHGGAGVCVIFVDAPSGHRAVTAQAPIQELFILLEGEATFVAGEHEIRGRAGDIVIVPPNTPHAFTNAGEQRLRQIDIHVNPTFNTKWL